MMYEYYYQFVKTGFYGFFLKSCIFSQTLVGGLRLLLNGETHWDLVKHADLQKKKQWSPVNSDAPKENIEMPSSETVIHKQQR